MHVPEVRVIHLKHQADGAITQGFWSFWERARTCTLSWKEGLHIWIPSDAVIPCSSRLPLLNLLHLGLVAMPVFPTPLAPCPPEPAWEVSSWDIVSPYFHSLFQNLIDITPSVRMGFWTILLNPISWIPFPSPFAFIFLYFTCHLQIFVESLSPPVEQKVQVHTYLYLSQTPSNRTMIPGLAEAPSLCSEFIP